MRHWILAFALVLVCAGSLLIPHSTPVSLAATAAATQAACDTAPVFAKLQSVKASGDNKSDLAALLQLGSVIDRLNIACNGVVANGNGSKIVGPFDIPKGTFRALIQTAGTISVQGEVLDGDCGQSSDDNTAFISVLLHAHIDEKVFDSNGCKLIANVTLTKGAWRLTIEPITVEPLQ